MPDEEIKDEEVTEDMDVDDGDIDTKKKKPADGDESLDALADDELEEEEDSFDDVDNL